MQGNHRFYQGTPNYHRFDAKSLREASKIEADDARYFQMAPNGNRWPQMAPNDSRWPQMAPDPS